MTRLAPMMLGTASAALLCSAVAAQSIAVYELPPPAGAIAAEPRAPERIPTEPRPDLVLKAIRQNMVKKVPVTYANLQMLADSGDGLAAYNVAKRLETYERDGLDADIVHYYTMAAQAGRDFAINGLINTLRTTDETIHPSRLKAAERVLIDQARRGNGRATKALLDFYQKGEPFGAKPEEKEKLLAMLAESGDADIALTLAMELARKSPLSDEERRRLLDYLAVAQTSEKLGTRALAENMQRLLEKGEAVADAEITP